MNQAIENSLLRSSEGHELVAYFQRLRRHGLSESTISVHLLDAVDRQSVPPCILMSVWLSFAQSPACVKQSIEQEFSVQTRRIAIKAFGRLLRKKGWRSLWEAFGAVEGMIALFAKLSVKDVRRFSKELNERVKKDKATGDRAAMILDLMHKLKSRSRVESSHPVLDPRPLQRFYITEIHDTAHTVQIIMEAIFINKKFNDVRYYLPYYFHDIQQGFPTEKGCSVSMSFSLAVLRKLVTQKDADFDEYIFLPQLVQPLLKRVWRKHRKAGFPLLKEIVNLSVEYPKYRKLQKPSTVLVGIEYLREVARYWSARTEMFEEELIELLRLSGIQKIRGDCRPGLRVMGIVSEVRVSMRYHLASLIFTEIMGPSTSIESVKDLADVNGAWPDELFWYLPRPQAVSLIQRLTQAKPNLGFIPSSPSDVEMFHMKKMPSSTDHDPLVWLHFLSQGNESALKAAKSDVDEQKKKAATAREQSDRAFYAKAAVTYAVASGSLACLKETLLWTRRFIRDPLTMKKLYYDSLFRSSQFVSLLAGLPDCTNLQNRGHPRGASLPATGSTSSVLKMSQLIAEANEIMEDIYETACQTIREPAFHASDWATPLRIFQTVVVARMAVVGMYQTSLKLSDQQVYDIVWKSTLETLIRVEKSALEPVHAKLHFTSQLGPLNLCDSFDQFSRDSNAPMPATCQFFDELAKRRDMIWKSKRKHLFSTVAVLPSPWPRGLPIQSLLGSTSILKAGAGAHIPFLSALAEQIVFMKGEEALSKIPNDEESRSAIDPYIDSYNLALKVYVLQGVSEEDRHNRVKLAWQHAVTTLSQGHMGTEETVRFWRAVFMRLPPEIAGQLPREYYEEPQAQYYPLIPIENQPDEPNEWDPSSPEPPEIKDFALVPTVIDCLLAADSDPRGHLPMLLSDIQHLVPGRSSREVWSLDRFPSRTKIPIGVQEGMIASKLLYLDSKKGGGPRILKAPFPSKEEARFPSLFLDAEFLSCQHSGDPIRVFLRNVPPALLLQLTSAHLSRLTEIEKQGSSDPGLETTTYGLISLLSESDRPFIAAELIQHTILDRPDASSWHRRLLSPTYLRTLSTRNANAFLFSFAAAIIARLQEQTQRRLKMEDASESSTKSPFIKITTIKYLAQLMKDADFVGPNASIDILARLYRQSTHIDIRVAVVESFTSMLADCKDEGSTYIANRLLTALKSAIPLLGGLSERRELFEDDWLECEREGRLPEVRDDATGNNLSPILQILVNAVANRNIKADHRKALMKEVLEPVVKVSSSNNRRWRKIFRDKYLPTIDQESLLETVYPSKPLLISTMLSRCLDLTPRRFINMHHAMILASINPASSLSRATELLKESPRSGTTSERDQYLFMSNPDGTFSLPHAIQRWDPSRVSQLGSYGIDLEHLQSLATEQARAFLDRYDTTPAHWDSLVDALRPSSPGQSTTIVEQKRWRENCAPLLHSLWKMVSNLRASDKWQRDPKRRPSVLPSTFTMELWFLPWPPPPPPLATDGPSWSAEPLVAAVHAVVSSLAAGRRPYAGDFSSLREMLLCIREETHRVEIGLTLASFLALGAVEVGLVDLLCLDLVEGLLVGSVDRDVLVARAVDVQGLMAALMGSRDEEVRRMGVTIRRHIGGEAFFR